MSIVRVTCPECDESIKVRASIPPGKKIECPECEAVFRVPKRSTGGISPILLAALIVGGVVLLAGVPVGAYFLLRSPPVPVGPVAEVKQAAHVANQAPPPPPNNTGINIAPGQLPNLNQPQVAQPNQGQKPNATATGVGLQIGQTAPDIEGEDLDGVPF